METSRGLVQRLAGGARVAAVAGASIGQVAPVATTSAATLAVDPEEAVPLVAVARNVAAEASTTLDDTGELGSHDVKSFLNLWIVESC